MKILPGRLTLIGMAGLCLLAWLPASRTGLTAGAPGRLVCGFREIIGQPCPLCGMTTSLEHFLAGRLRDAWRAHRAGPVVFIYGGLWALAWVGARRSPLIARGDRVLRSRALIGAIVAAILTAWIFRLFKY